MLSLVEQLHNFLAEWQANQELAGKAGVSVVRCALCGRERYGQYLINVGESFCSSQCIKRYEQIVKAGVFHAVEK